MRDKVIALALRLADALERRAPVLYGIASVDLAVYELRRLHAVNAELVEALTEYVNNDDVSLHLNGIKSKARAAIAKAGEQP